MNAQIIGTMIKGKKLSKLKKKITQNIRLRMILCKLNSKVIELVSGVKMVFKCLCMTSCQLIVS